MQTNKTESSQTVPVLPSWLDLHSFPLQKKIVCVAVLRAITASICFISNLLILINYHHPAGVLVALSFITCVNILHVFSSVYFAFKVQNGGLPVIERWFYCDIIFTGLFIILTLTFLCIAPPTRSYITSGVIFICISVLLTYRFTTYYRTISNTPSLAQIL